MTNFQNIGSGLFSVDVTIASGASVSEPFNLQGKALVGIVMPAAWTAAGIAFAGSVSGRIADMQQIYDNGGNPEYCTAAASKPIAFPNSDALFFPFLQLISVSTADKVTPVAQGADRTLTLFFRSLFS